MRRRLDLAASLIVRPRVLFLDEPTTGLDPRSRTEVWESIRALVGDGTTVLLTTQYLEEADQLADRISVIDHGRVVADGTPDELKARIGGDRIDVVLRDAGQLAAAASVIGMAARAGSVETDPDRRRIGARVTDRVAAPHRDRTGAGRGRDRGGGHRPAPPHPRRGVPAPDRRRRRARDPRATTAP